MTIGFFQSQHAFHLKREAVSWQLKEPQAQK